MNHIKNVSHQWQGIQMEEESLCPHLHTRDPLYFQHDTNNVVSNTLASLLKRSLFQFWHNSEMVRMACKTV